MMALLYKVTLLCRYVSFNYKNRMTIIVIKYYFETQNNILYVIGYEISKDL